MPITIRVLRHPFPRVHAVIYHYDDRTESAIRRKPNFNRTRCFLSDDSKRTDGLLVDYFYTYRPIRCTVNARFFSKIYEDGKRRWGGKLDLCQSKKG